jgi:hypothetical protein
MRVSSPGSLVARPMQCEAMMPIAPKHGDIETR